MKGNIQKDGMWWSWIENCDRCGKLICSCSTQNSRILDMEEADFCLECLRYLLDNNISYADAKEQYKR